MDPYSGNAFFLMGLTVLDLGLGICGGGGMNEADLRLGSYIWMVTGLGQNPAVSKYSHLITRASNVSIHGGFSAQNWHDSARNEYFCALKTSSIRSHQCWCFISSSSSKVY